MGETQDEVAGPIITDEQRGNLAALAEYLESGPALRFDMARFAADGERHEIDPEAMLRCGTAACALGHGPFAGLPAKRQEEWKDYAFRVFGVGPTDIGSQSPAFLWMFGGAWAEIDNSPDGAAARIRWFLRNGVPPDSDEQQMGDAPLCYPA